jgi:hypothetical protein
MNNFVLSWAADMSEVLDLVHYASELQSLRLYNLPLLRNHSRSEDMLFLLGRTGHFD